jgi:hypothetical protein
MVNLFKKLATVVRPNDQKKKDAVTKIEDSRKAAGLELDKAIRELSRARQKRHGNGFT